jgi:hypothetical protein
MVMVAGQGSCSDWALDVTSNWEWCFHDFHGSRQTTAGFLDQEEAILDHPAAAAASARAVVPVAWAEFR